MGRGVGGGDVSFGGDLAAVVVSLVSRRAVMKQETCRQRQGRWVCGLVSRDFLPSLEVPSASS